MVPGPVDPLFSKRPQERLQACLFLLLWEHPVPFNVNGQINKESRQGPQGVWW